ncbi:cation-translocating P-type ATPase [Arthrobacter sp. zg-Y820]|uniref:cation-translocating P-type ATPase n=1 Tax=unclassified Arthrobacter TaxID=235627 RepID=UPI001E56CFC2|nr:MULTISPECIES: cation-translocating P-type ATPase [unclassified Arthrobacter]MCC9196656.1 cation-translocating P-type ATPase [Arthrobacter sp. zg-Y820]MDK1279518.1 cation-translocating P-type ATPase [Arthrobacter sp. zg.Y820]WIB08105.1 cation-translocating P-type ATPase [Arthrobacter sp. zg-Y820]
MHVDDQMPEQPWTLSASQVAAQLEVTPDTGLSADQAQQRTTRYGRNELAAGRKVPAWRKILGLLTDRLILVLIGAAVISAVVSREWETPVVILAVITLNTVLNYVQEQRAENSLEALRSTSISVATVRRGGRTLDIPRTDLVPGDVVLLEAGDTIPADGRLLEAVRLQVAEAALTGESQPVNKTTAALADPELPVGDRTNMLYMDTDVSRGRAVLLVTGTGMETQIGRIAHLLGTTADEKTILQRSIDQLARLLTYVALIVVAVVFVLGLLRGDSWEDLFLTAVSLAVATIPEGLTAVVAFTLAMGASRLAARGAIIKQLAAVETLGSTSQICTDKTGTLTLNEMTVRRVYAASGRVFRVSGSGYSTEGALLSADGHPVSALTPAFLGFALCNDASVRNGVLTGDPTEGALVVLAEKGGIDADGARASHPRMAEVPFDSDYKFMATFNRSPGGGDAADDASGERAPGEAAGGELFCYAKGAPGVLLERSEFLSTADGDRPLRPEDRKRISEEVAALARQGLRTMAAAGRPVDGGLPADSDALRDSVTGLTLYAVVGIMDPPRPEAAEAIARAHRAGISVHMITGDHLITASAIAKDLGIGGEAVSGSALDGLDDQALRERAPGYGVLARVSPEHKIRMVEALQADGAVVAMTGDGVNDAPALKRADIGIAMGITGTDVSKGAARMILTDDNFATIVTAVQEGRGIYANILKFVSFQLTTAWGFVLIFLAAAAFSLAGGAPFTALQILWVNIIMDGPPALALGVDPADPDLMKQPPRPAREPLLTRRRILRILTMGIVMAVGTCSVLYLAPQMYPESAGDPLFATTLAFTTFVFYQAFNLLNVRSATGSVFSLHTFTNRAIWVSLAAVVVLQVLVVQLGVLQGLFDTTDLTSGQWFLALGVGSTALWISEIRKAVSRFRLRTSAPAYQGEGL